MREGWHNPSFKCNWKLLKTNVRENRRGNQEWTIQRNWQHWVHKTQSRKLEKDEQREPH